MTTRRWMLWSLIGLAAAFAATGGDAEAGKKPAPPPPPPVPGGTIWFVAGAGMWTMNSDGTAKTPLPSGVPNAAGDSQHAHPSYGLHAGHRWFLGSRTIPGEFFPGGTIQRRSIVAVRDDGAVVAELLAQPDLLVATAYSRWSRDDSQVSLVAARYVDGVRGPYEIYTASVAFDAVGDVAGLVAQPVDPAFALSSTAVIDTDWSPDGVRIVAAADGALWIGDLTTGTATQLPTSVSPGGPSWSPDAARIAFSCRLSNGSSAVRSIAPSGSGETTIVSASAPIYSPTWSPDGTHLVYQYLASSLSPDVYRVPAVGGTAVNLTGDLSSFTTPWGWR